MLDAEPVFRRVDAIGNNSNGSLISEVSNLIVLRRAQCMQAASIANILSFI
jgi:hypothetical protein